MQIELFNEFMNFSGKKILIGLSGGINSMAVLCQLKYYPPSYLPDHLYLYYIHFEEHSLDTLEFVLAGTQWAQSLLPGKVTYKQDNVSVLEYFKGEKMIPHPMFSPCTHNLKITPMAKFVKEQGIDIDLVGYVRDERRRMVAIANKHNDGAIADNFQIRGVHKAFPILSQTNEWCFQIVKDCIGWYPSIYDIKEKGKRVFKHNNCLPCKNMTKDQLAKVDKYFPEQMQRAQEAANEIGAYWGRGKDDSHCAVCEF